MLSTKLTYWEQHSCHRLNGCWYGPMTSQEEWWSASLTTVQAHSGGSLHCFVWGNLPHCGRTLMVSNCSTCCWQWSTQREREHWETALQMAASRTSTCLQIRMLGIPKLPMNYECKTEVWLSLYIELRLFAHLNLCPWVCFKLWQGWAKQICLKVSLTSRCRLLNPWE